MAKKMLFLIMLSFSLAIGSFWVLKAQDPAPQPSPTKTMPQATAATSTQVDLSGTYAGTFNCESGGLMGDTTLTINGNEFTTSDGKSGRIVASKSRGYTAVAVQMSGAGSKVISLRGRKSGNKLTLTPIAGSMEKCTFTPSKMAKTPAVKGTDVANPAAKPAESPMPSQTPSPSPEASPSPEPNPSPEASPTPSGSPRPRPTPTPSPGEPTPSPSPTPTPTPRP